MNTFFKIITHVKYDVFWDLGSFTALQSLKKALWRHANLSKVSAFKPATLPSLAFLYRFFLTFCNILNGLKSQNTSQMIVHFKVTAQRFNIPHNPTYEQIIGNHNTKPRNMTKCGVFRKIKSPHICAVTTTI